MEESGFYDLSLQEQIVFALDCIDSYDYIRSFSYIINEQDRHTINMVYRNRLKETLDGVETSEELYLALSVPMDTETLLIFILVDFDRSMKKNVWEE